MRMQQINLCKLFAFTLLLTTALQVMAAPDNPNTPAPAKTEKSAPPTANDKGTAPTDDKTLGVKAPAAKRRDPFFSPARYVPPPPPPKIEKPVKPEPKPVPPPTAENRFESYRASVRDYLNGRGVEPSKLSAYVLDELTLTGVFRTEDGYGAFIVESATPKQQTYFARAGWQTFDGYIKEILPTGVRFVKIVRYDNGSVQQTEMFRPLPLLNTK